MPTEWTKEKINLMRRYYPSGDLDALAERLGTSVMALRQQAMKLGIKRKVNVRKPWTWKQLIYLRDFYPSATMETLKILTEHPETSIRRMAAKMKLRKCDGYLQTPRPYSKRYKDYNQLVK